MGNWLWAVNIDDDFDENCTIKLPKSSTFVFISEWTDVRHARQTKDETTAKHRREEKKTPLRSNRDEADWAVYKSLVELESKSFSFFTCAEHAEHAEHKHTHTHASGLGAALLVEMGKRRFAYVSHFASSRKL